jgi:hypothetical protein
MQSGRQALKKSEFPNAFGKIAPDIQRLSAVTKGGIGESLR